jgi:hypothetical protein
MIAASAQVQPPPALAPLYGTYLVGLGSALAANLVIRLGAEAGWLPVWGQVAVGVAGVVPLILAAWTFWRLLRRDLDEMLQRIVLEGMAFGLVLYVPLSALYLNLDTAGISLRIQAIDVLMTPAILVAIGVALAWRRYQ